MRLEKPTDGQLLIYDGDIDCGFVHLGDQLAEVIAGTIRQDSDGVAAAKDLDLIRCAAEALRIERIAVLVLDDNHGAADSWYFYAVYHCNDLRLVV